MPPFSPSLFLTRWNYTMDGKKLKSHSTPPRALKMEHFGAVLIWGQGWEGEFWLFKGCTENTVNITLWKVKWYSGLKMLEVHLDKFVCTFLHVCIFVYVYLLNVRVWRGGVSVGLLVDLQFNIRSAIVSSSLGKLDGSIYCIHYILEAWYLHWKQ